MTRIVRPRVALLLVCLTGLATPRAQAVVYPGNPDLGLTAAVVTAGGGAADFDAAKLLGVLTGPHKDAELASLTTRFGADRVDKFVATFTFAIRDALKVAQANNVALPPPTPGLATDGAALSKQLYAAGTMPNGHWDVGYMIENLISHPIHHAIMMDIDNDPAYGPSVNADFHVILTAAMADLHSLYGGPGA